MASASDPTTALQGDALDALLDHVEAIFDSDDEDTTTDWASRQTAAQQALAQQSLQPDDMDQLRRVFRLYMMSGQPAAAYALVDAHRERLLGDLAFAPRQSAAVALAMMQADAAEDIPDAAAQYRASIAHAADAIAQWGDDGDPERAWSYLIRHAQVAKAYDLQERIYRAQHQLHSKSPERSRFRAWDDAVLATRLGQIEAAKGNTTSARDFGRYAIHKLQQPGDGQEIDTDDWLRLGSDIIDLAPDALAEYSQATLASLPPNASPAMWRDTHAQLARLAAASLHRQGQVDAAIAKGLEGRFALVRDSDDSGSATLIQWLLQAGRLPEAAHMAFESALHSRGGAREEGARQAQTHLHEAAGAPYWALTLMAASADEDMGEFLPEGMDAAQSFAHYSALAQQQSPNHPAWRLVQGNALFAAGQYAQALPLLETLTNCPQYANGELTYRLFIARARAAGPGAAGLTAALATPYIRSDGGSWCYSMGVQMDDNAELMSDLGLEGDTLPGNWPRDALLRWSTHYYEAGLARFEQWFATGHGNYKDGNLHDYSMLCNNLAIKYRYDDSNYDGALALHAKGIASSPFAEHYNGILSVYTDAENYPQIIAAAEQLWHYSKENGYGRHEPADYFPDVAYALHQEDRNVENSIWLERLDEWWSSLDDEDKAQSRRDYLRSLLNQLDYYSATHGAEVLPRLQALLPELYERQDAYLLRRAGDAMQTSGTAEQAMQIYQEARRHSSKTSAEERKCLEDKITELAPAARKAAKASAGGASGSSTGGDSKPWWKFW